NTFASSFEAYLLKIQDDFSYIFDYAFNRIEFMIYCSNLDSGNCISLQRTEQHSTQSVTDGYTISWLQRTEFKLCFEVSCFLQYNFVGLLETQYSHIESLWFFW